MNWLKLAENRIEEAIANGEFENLPGQGRPLDLGEYFALPAAERAGVALLKSAQVVPPEVELLQRIAELEAVLADAERAERLGRRPSRGGELQVTKLREELQEKRVTLAMALERRKRREPRAVE
jgi:hypothetical protein